MSETRESRSGPGLKIAVMASAGAAVEWYDFFIYGTAAALVFPHLFFPADLPPLVAQIASFSTFAVGFIARPLGGMLFGHFGDIHGRKRALVVAMFLMGGSTTLIGFLPGYGQVGILAPLLLVALRFAQGLAVGGQWGGAALLAIESAPENRRGFYGSFVQVGVPLGVVVANGVFLIVGALTSDDVFMSWGWRIGFVASVGLIFIGMALHLGVSEPAGEGEAAPPPVAGERRRSPLAEVARGHWRAILLAGGAFVANNTCFYVAITYVVAYGTTSLGIDRNILLMAVMVGSVLMVPFLIGCGALSDRFGRRGIFLAGALLSGIWAFVAFPLIGTASPTAIILAVTVQLAFISMMYGPQAALFAELFPKSVRYSGASLGYQIGSVVGGGFAPIVATALFARYQDTVPISIYLAAMCAISFISVIMLGRHLPANSRTTDRLQISQPNRQEASQ
ncbi:MFS transporter [Brevundimonas lenta]|uniref:Metabolite-proton symporter n=1 Tax=Brevundimonas lenta TaxID=424796 RepID=A0A7W6JCZ0_9CAUL|nr:MFS transporter [Brevundimonas lenta]MBB4082853.1 metabolite-proton symporter [Brevundimonas lenta]